jgi:prophage maintenance system killer protein
MLILAKLTIQRLKMRQPEALKEYYRLWVEYLKESDIYKIFCERRVELERDAEKNIYDPLTEKQSDSDSRRLFKRKVAYEQLVDIFDKFADIHSSDYDFERWWDHTLKDMNKRIANPSIVDKLDVGAIAMELLDDIEDVYEEQVRDEIDFDDIRISLSDSCGEYKGQLVLKIDTYYPVNTLVKRFERIIRQHKKDYRITVEAEDQYMHMDQPVIRSNHLTNEIDKYLKVYRLKKNMKWLAVVKEITPRSGTYTDKKGKLKVLPDTLRTFQRYRSKAKKIIKNVEKDIFPGQY